LNQYIEYAFVAVAGVLAITLHEAAHGYAAWALGDDTAKRLGRLSLNPLVHVDQFGTIVFPAILVIGQLITVGHVQFMFGWAKPVPVAAWKFPNPRRGMLVVAAAGPLMNFFLAWIACVAMNAVPFVPAWLGAPMVLFALYFVLLNLGLGLFNLLPVPPLDGGRIVVGLLPERAAQKWAKLERAGIVIVLLLIFVLPAMFRDLFSYDFNPVTQWVFAIARPLLRLLLTLAGNPDAGLLIEDQIFGG
jgi:Zn-dependent protease